MLKESGFSMIFTFLFFLFSSQAQTQDSLTSGSDKIWNDNDCPHVENKKDCQDAECCKAHCTNDKNCTAVNFKPGDCVLRGCKCTGLVEPSWENAGYKGYVVTDLLGLYRFNKNEIKLEKNKKLDELPYIGKEFSVSFQLFLDSYPAADVPFV